MFRLQVRVGVCLAVVLVGMACGLLEQRATQWPVATLDFLVTTEAVTPTVTRQGEITPADVGTELPGRAAGTAEPLWVEPVQATTDQLSQVVTVRIGNGVKVVITCESGTFTAEGQFNAYSNPAQVEVTLLPNTVHHLEIEATVAAGYSLRTTRDRGGNPLVIQQGQPQPRLPGAPISVGNASKLEELVSLSPSARMITDFAFWGSQQMVGVGYNGENTVAGVTLWDLASGQRIQQFGDASAEALVVRVSADGNLIATGGAAGGSSVQLWDYKTGEMRELGRHEQGRVRGLAFSPSGSRLASGDDNGQVKVWDVASGQMLVQLEGESPNNLMQAFGSLYWVDEQTLITAGSDMIYRWDVGSGEAQLRLPIPAEVSFFVETAFSQNGERLAGVAQDNRVYFWDRQVGDWVTWQAAEGLSLATAAFSPDGQLLAAAPYEGSMLIWEVSTGQLLATYPVVGKTLKLRFSPDGRYIAVGGGEGAIRMWGEAN